MNNAGKETWERTVELWGGKKLEKRLKKNINKNRLKKKKWKISKKIRETEIHKLTNW